jgi:hypothetical protein
MNVKTGNLIWICYVDAARFWSRTNKTQIKLFFILTNTAVLCQNGIILTNKVSCLLSKYNFTGLANHNTSTQHCRFLRINHVLMAIYDLWWLLSTEDHRLHTPAKGVLYTNSLRINQMSKHEQKLSESEWCLESMSNFEIMRVRRTCHLIQTCHGLEV